MDTHRNGNAVHGKSQRPKSARRAGENDPFNNSTSTDPKYLETEITKDNDEVMNKFVQAMKTIHEFPIDHLEQLLFGPSTANGTSGLYGQERDTKWAEARDWQEKYKILEQNHEDLQQKFNKIESEMQVVKDKNEKLVKESKFYQEKLQEKESQLQEQREAVKKANKEKDDVMSRLSRHMGQQMSEGNPNITDLSDPNRPSKLGERYSELYDNEWTNAFESLTKTFGMDDKEAVDVLRNILWKSYENAFDISRTQIKEAEYKLSGSSKVVSSECKRLLKEAQKHIDIKQADDLIENALQRTEMKYSNETLVHVFAKECFQLCWLMSIQDPPVVLVEEPTKGDRFDTNIYKHYVNSGDKVDYVVWPALLLHKGGPLLTKGVAQPFPRSRPRSAFSFEENKKTNERTSDKFSRSLYVGKVQEQPSSADRRNPNQDDLADQWNSSCQTKMDNHPTETQTYTSQGGMAATQNRTTYPMQFGINRTLVDDEDARQFNYFCQYYFSFGERASRQQFGSNFDRYYKLYLCKGYRDHTFA